MLTQQTDVELPEAFMVIPAVDILADEAVRLESGDYERVSVRAGDPAVLVARLARDRPPFIHVVDLDGARSGRIRPQLIASLARRAAPVPLQVGGGIRSRDDGRALLDAGAHRIIVGTAAFEHVGSLAEFIRVFGSRLVVALDVSEESVKVGGWLRSSGLRPEDAGARCRAAGARRVLCTSIARDGTLSGPDLPLLERVAAASGGRVLAAGGVRSSDDLLQIASAGLEGAVVGRALFASHGATARTPAGT